jgi:hypothetical protein
MPDLFWLADANMVRLEPSLPKTNALPVEQTNEAPLLLHKRGYCVAFWGLLSAAHKDFPCGEAENVEV